MKKRTKQFLATLLTVIMLLSTVPLSDYIPNITSQAASAPTISYTYEGERCNDEPFIIEWNAAPEVTSYYVEIQLDGAVISSGNATISNGRAKYERVLGYYGKYGVYTASDYDFVIVGYTPTAKYTYNLKDKWIGNCSKIYMPISDYGLLYWTNDGTENYTTQDFPNPCSGTVTVSNYKPTRSGYTFLGWSKDKSTVYPEYVSGDKIGFNHDRIILYAIWKKNEAKYTINYIGNGASSNIPSSQTKTEGVNINISSTVPKIEYKLNFNANGGSVSQSTKTVKGTFRYWNTASNGSGTRYNSSSTYSQDKDLTLYAIYDCPTAGTLPTPTKSGYKFAGWYDSASGGTKYNSDSPINGEKTLYAHWNQDIYNLGEESYSFDNFSDNDSNGHCFGMSVTSSGYHIGKLNITSVGGNTSDDVFALSKTSSVKRPICYYQSIQGSKSMGATVAGGSYYKTGYSDISSDWNAVINYVKNHEYDDKGTLQVGFRRNSEGGHAINFLRYAEVDGQQRIYVYDNNFPNTETYLYKNSKGEVHQAPYSTFSGTIDCIALRNVEKYFNLVENTDLTRYIYADKDTVLIEGADIYAIDGGVEAGERVVFEVPSDLNQVIIVPLVDGAEFSYLNEEYRFGNINDETTGIFTLSTNDETGTNDPELTILNGEKPAESISITKMPNKMNYTYKVDGYLDLTGIEITAKYADGSTEKITDTSKITVSGYNSKQLGDQNATIECASCTANITVNVSYTWWQWIIRILLLGIFWY